MAEIEVQSTGGSRYRVTVTAGGTTTHEVTVPPAYYQALTGGAIPEAELIRRSFEFLLQRESNTMILRQFELPVIQRYFPEYERTLRVT